MNSQNSALIHKLIELEDYRRSLSGVLMKMTAEERKAVRGTVEDLQDSLECACGFIADLILE